MEWFVLEDPDTLDTLVVVDRSLIYWDHTRNHKILIGYSVRLALDD